MPRRKGGLALPESLPERLRGAVVDRLPAPAERALRRALRRPRPRTVALSDLDRELERAAALFSVSEDQARAFLRGFELEPPRDRPPDPFSERYRDWVWSLYHTISGRPTYELANESSPFDLDEAVKTPYPYSTRSTTVVGEELIARGFIISTLGIGPPARIVEFGSGWGNLTLDLAATGFDVTAVEVEERFGALLRRRTRHPERLRVVQSGMLEFEPQERFDVAIFYESFHHCADHVEMLRRLHDVVTPSGVVVWAGEPVGPLPYPWGLRLDGYSVWSTRTYGWLELGFDVAYFEQALERTGWRGSRRRLPAGSPLADVIVGRRVS